MNTKVAIVLCPFSLCLTFVWILLLEIRNFQMVDTKRCDYMAFALAFFVKANKCLCAVFACLPWLLSHAIDVCHVFSDSQQRKWIQRVILYTGPRKYRCCVTNQLVAYQKNSLLWLWLIIWYLWTNVEF